MIRVVLSRLPLSQATKKMEKISRTPDPYFLHSVWEGLRQALEIAPSRDLSA
jgi:hypothetical protein